MLIIIYVSMVKIDEKDKARFKIWGLGSFLLFFTEYFY